MQFAIVVQPVFLKGRVSLQEHTHPVVDVVFRHNSLHIDPAIPSVRLFRDQFALVPVQVLRCILVVDVSSFLVLSVVVCVRETVVHRPCSCAIRSTSSTEPKVSWSCSSVFASSRLRVGSISWLSVPPSLMDFFVPESSLAFLGTVKPSVDSY